MKATKQIVTALQVRLAQLRQPPASFRKRLLANEVAGVLHWIRTGKVTPQLNVTLKGDSK